MRMLLIVIHHDPINHDEGLRERKIWLQFAREAKKKSLICAKLSPRLQDCQQACCIATTYFVRFRKQPFHLVKWS